MKNFIIIILGFVVFASCGKSNKDKSFSLLQKWIGKELSLPARSVFTIQGKDTVEYPIQNAYKILTYIDSTGCTSCKLKLAEWEKFITVVDSIRPHTVQFLFSCVLKMEWRYIKLYGWKGLNIRFVLMKETT